MNRRTRTRVALVSALPSFLTVPLCAVPAAAGVVSWAVLPALLLAVLVQPALTYTRLTKKAQLHS